MRTAVLLAALLALPGCSKSDNAPGPGGVTVGEAKALAQPAEIIESRRMPPEALATIPPSEAPPLPPKK